MTMDNQDAQSVTQEQIAAAIKATEYKYFGDYEMSDDQRDAVDVLVRVAQARLASQPTSAEDAVSLAGRLEALAGDCDNTDGWQGASADVRQAAEIIRTVSRPTPDTQTAAIGAEGLDTYDAGLLNDYGGGDVDWWQDYIRAELGRAHDFYADQFATLSQPVAAPQAETAPAPSGRAQGEVELRKALAKIMPIRVHNGSDYAEVYFADGSKHSTQAMTMNPQDWLDIQAAYDAAPTAQDQTDER